MQYQIRSATLADVPLLCQQRRQMFEDMGHTDTERLHDMSVQFADWLRYRMSHGSYFAWLIEAGDAIVAGAGLWLIDWPPHVLDPIGPRAYILNIYTDQQHRRRGLARQLTEQCLTFCRERHINWVSLHASAGGKSLYESLGFQPTNEMRLPIDWHQQSRHEVISINP